MTILKSAQAFDQFDEQIEIKTSLEEIWNDHWNNNVSFCGRIQLYMTFSYKIKCRDIGCFKYVFEEITVIL